MDKIPDHYDVIIVGSGLAESVAAGYEDCYSFPSILVGRPEMY